MVMLKFYLAIAYGLHLQNICAARVELSTCLTLVKARCGQMTNVKICTTDQTFQDWCSFETDVCHKLVEQNRTVVITGYGQHCNLTRAVALATPDPTHTTDSNSRFATYLFSAAIHGIDDLLTKSQAAGTPIDQVKKIFTIQDHTHKRYVRNTKCWAYPLDLTGISPWNSQGHTRRAGVLVSPRHLLWARHYSMKLNTTVRFVDKHNQVVERRIMKERSVPVNGSRFLTGYDLVVGVLDSDVPSTIGFAKVLPHNLTTIRPPLGMRVPVFDTDFEEKALVADFRTESGTMVYLSAPISSSYRHQLYETKIVGDSGNPVFFVIDNQLVLLFVFTYGGAGGGTSITYHYDNINNIMRQLGGGYQLTEVNLTGYHGLSHIPSFIGR